MLRRVAFLVCLAACAHNPATGRLQLSLVSESEEIEAGKRGLVGLRAELKPIDDAPIAAYVRDFGLTLARASQRPHLPWSFTVMDDPVVNAFALPGGQIVITRGLLAHLRSEADLAVVLGHEVGHVAARHTATMMSHESLLKRGLAAGTSVLPNTWASAVTDAFSKGAELLFIQYGRSDEQEADTLGFRYAVAAGFDARAGAVVFDTLGKVNHASAIPLWLSTHPSPESRVEAVWHEAASAQIDWASLRSNDEAYAKQIDGLVYGDDPREGAIDGATYVHAALGLRVTLDPSLALAKKGSALLAVDGAHEAVLELRVVPEPAEIAEAAFVTLRRARVTGRDDVTGVAFEGADGCGFARFVRKGSRTVRLVLTAPCAKIDAVKDSFGRITIENVVASPPKVQTLRAFKTPRAMTLRELQAEAPSTVTLDVLELLNGVGKDEPIPAGRWLKRVSAD